MSAAQKLEDAVSAHLRDLRGAAPLLREMGLGKTADEILKAATALESVAEQSKRARRDRQRKTIPLPVRDTMTRN